MKCPCCSAAQLETIYWKYDLPVLRCVECGQVFSGKIPYEEEIRKLYENYYSERNTTPNEVTRKRYSELLRRFRRYRETNRILDVGCGFGFFLSAAMDDGWRAYGTEVSQSAFHYLEKLEIPDGQMFMGDVADMGLEEGSFDVVTMFEVIEHLPDPSRVLREICSLLRKDGLLYLTTPNYDSLNRYLLGDFWSIIQPHEHLFYFTVGSLGRLLRRVGYEVRSFRTTGWNYYEALNHFGLRRTSSSYVAMQQARVRFERNEVLKFLKRNADGLFSLMRLGDTIKVFAEKRG